MLTHTTHNYANCRLQVEFQEMKAVNDLLGVKVVQMFTLPPTDNIPVYSITRKMLSKFSDKIE